MLKYTKHNRKKNNEQVFKKSKMGREMYTNECESQYLFENSIFTAVQFVIQ